MAQLIDGKKIADGILSDLKKKVALLSHKPGLAIILVGDDPASHLYVKLKNKAAEECGINMHIYCLNPDSSEKNIFEVIGFLNSDPDVHGIIVQLPLPDRFNEDRIITAIASKKDVDGFHPDNLRALASGSSEKPHVVSGLALGIMRLIESTGQDMEGKNVLIVSNSPVFAAPLLYLFKQHGLSPFHATPEIQHLPDLVAQADILIVAIGKKNFIKKSWVKDGAIVIDVGTNRLRSGKVVGDVNPRAAEKAAFITPVPGGVGPMTVAMLLWNTYLLAEKQQ